MITYHITQQSGTMFGLPSDLQPDTFIKSEMDLGSGLDRVHIWDDNKWQLIYSQNNPEHVKKYGRTKVKQ